MNVRSSWVAWTALLIGSAACAPRPPGAIGGANANLVRYTGLVLVSGTEGSAITSLYVEGRSPIGLLGSLSAELRALSGARVTVEGASTSGGPGAAVDVSSYEVVEVNGQKPYVGTLVRSGAGYALQQVSTVLPLEQLPAGLAEQIGAKIWVTGVLSGERLQIQSFGIIRVRL